MDDFIAEQTLYFDRDPTRGVVVRLGKPQPNADGSECACVYQVHTAEAIKEMRAFGIDAFQAIQNAFTMLGGELAFLENEASIQLYDRNGDRVRYFSNAK